MTEVALTRARGDRRRYVLEGIGGLPGRRHYCSASNGRRRRRGVAVQPSWAGGSGDRPRRHGRRLVCPRQGGG